MPKFKEMPYKEKYEKALEGIEFMKSMVQPFIKMHLTDNAIKELQKTWDEGLKPIPEAGSFKEKYETAYSNYIWVDKSAYNFIRKEIGKDGIEKFKNVEIEGLKQKKRRAGYDIFGNGEKNCSGIRISYDKQRVFLPIAMADTIYSFRNEQTKNGIRYTKMQNSRL